MRGTDGLSIESRRAQGLFVSRKMLNTTQEGLKDRISFLHTFVQSGSNAPITRGEYKNGSCYLAVFFTERLGRGETAFITSSMIALPIAVR